MNNWENYKKIEGRTFDLLIQNLAKQVTVPCRVVQWGERQNGTPWCIVLLDRPSRNAAPAPKMDEPIKEVK